MDNTEYLKQITDAEKKQKQIELEQAKASALTSIGQEQAKVAPAFTAQRQAANVSSQIGAKNFAEYLANRQQTGAGVSAQAELSRQNVLGNTLTGINTNENNTNTEFANQKGQVETNYQSGLTNAFNAADTNLTTNLYNEKLRQQGLELDRQNADYKERVRQEEMAISANQRAFENNLAIKKYNADRADVAYDRQIEGLKTKEQNYVGALRNLEGKNQVWNGKTWTDIKYATEKKDKKTVLTAAAQKQKAMNDNGFGLTTTSSGISYKENGKDKEYKTWVKEGIPYVAIKDEVFPMVITPGKEAVMNSLLERAVETGKITPSQRAQLLNKIEVY